MGKKLLSLWISNPGKQFPDLQIDMGQYAFVCVRLG
jgi:hypothetical protein